MPFSYAACTSGDAHGHGRCDDDEVFSFEQARVLRAEDELDAEVAERLEVGFDVFFHLRIGERDSSTEPAADASRRETADARADDEHMFCGE